MKYRLRLLKPETETSTFGEEKTEYKEQATVWAQLVRSQGYRSEEVGEHFPDYQVEFNIRDAHTVGENWRAQMLGGYLYTVTNVLPNLDRGYLTLKCTRVNE